MAAYLVIESNDGEFKSERIEANDPLDALDKFGLFDLDPEMLWANPDNEWMHVYQDMSVDYIVHQV